MRLEAFLPYASLAVLKRGGKKSGKKRKRETERKRERGKKNLKKKIWCTTIVMRLVPLIAHTQ